MFLPDPEPGEDQYFGKEAHFFDREERFSRGLDFYTCRFEPGRDRIKGDMTPNYCTLPLERIMHIHSLMPNARLLYLLRNPIERA